MRFPIACGTPQCGSTNAGVIHVIRPGNDISPYLPIGSNPPHLTVVRRFAVGDAPGPAACHWQHAGKMLKPCGRYGGLRLLPCRLKTSFVLVIDTNDHAETVAEILEGDGYAYVVAKAREIQSEEFDLLLTDLHMGDLDGDRSDGKEHGDTLVRLSAASDVKKRQALQRRFALHLRRLARGTTRL